MNDSQLRVLLIEDNPTDVLLLQAALEEDRLSEFVITHVDQLAEAFARLREMEFDIIVSDLGLPDGSGFMTFERLHVMAPDLPIVVFSGNLDEAVAVQAVQAGAQDYLVKSLGGFEIASRTLRYAVERHKTQLALRQSEARFSKAFVHSPVGTVLLSLPELRVVDINLAALMIWDFKREAVLGHTTAELGVTIIPDQRSARQEQLAAEGQLHNLDTQLQRRDGSVRDVLLSVETVEIGAQPHLLALIVDNTERKQAERALRKREEWFFTAFYGSPSAQCITRIADEKFVDVNEAFCALSGFSRDELLGHATSELGLWNEPNARAAMIEQWALQGYARNVEIEFRSKAGGLLILLVSSGSIDMDGEACVISSALDITERKQAEAELRLHSELMANMSEGINLVRAKDGIIVFTNPRFDEMFGYQPGELLGQHISIVNAPPAGSQEEVAHAIERAVQATGAWSGEVHNQKKNGELFWSFASVRLFEHPVYGRVGLSVQADITKMKQAEQQLAESEERHRLISSITSDYVYSGIKTAEGKAHLLWVSGAFERITGYSREEVNSLPNGFHSLVLPEEFEALVISKPELKHASAVALDYHIRRKDGELRWLHDTSRRFTEGGLVKQVGAVEDITERKAAEEKLRKSEERFFAAFHGNASAQLIVRRANLEIIDANEAYCQLIGLSQAELIGHHTEQFNLWADSTNREHMVEQWRQQGHVRNLEVEFRKITGEVHTLLCSAEPIEINGENCIISTALDITDRKLADERLRQSEEQYRLLSEQLEARVQQRTAEVQDLYDYAPSGYHSLDAEGRFVTINQTELNWLGYTRSEILGRTFLEFVTPQGAATFRENFPKFRESGQLANLEMELRRKDGSVLPVLVNATAIYSASGEYVMSRSTLSDITERKKAELAILLSRDELKVAYAALEKASRAKDEFLATMSHELRTPLNGILGISEILLDGYRGALNEKQQKLVHAIDNSGRHLLSLINDILDLSKIEAGRLELHLEPLSIQDVCQSSLAFIREAASIKGLSLEFVPDPAAGLVMADLRQLKQILVNLLNNAVKFTPAPGKVTLQVHAHAALGQLEFSVSDTGIGIAAADLKRLFSPFTQVDSSLTREHEGTGLGLALVKRLAELHGGTVSVVSEVGQGSRFTVALPWQPNIQVKEAQVDTNMVNITTPSLPITATSLGTILLAEDTETNIMMMGDYLADLGYNMLYARTGYEALEKASENLPDLILMDIQMPQLDGLEATRRLRANPRYVTTPIIALTALAMPGDRERCLAAGVNEYVSKPVRLKQLSQMIQQLLGRN